MSGRDRVPPPGHDQYVAPGIDPATGTLLVQGILANPNFTCCPASLRQDAPADGTGRPQRCWCPTAHCRKIRGGRYLLTVNKDDVVEQRYVQLGQLDGTLRVIVSGLKPDDRVVIGDLWRASPAPR